MRRRWPWLVLAFCGAAVTAVAVLLAVDQVGRGPSGDTLLLATEGEAEVDAPPARVKPIGLPAPAPSAAGGLANAQALRDAFAAFATPPPEPADPAGEAATTEAPEPDPPPAAPVSGDLLDAIAMCESGMNPLAYNPAGYYGAFQFSLGTWAGVGYAGDPRDYPYAVQKQAAALLQAKSGWGAWPHCASKLGLL